MIGVASESTIIGAMTSLGIVVLGGIVHLIYIAGKTRQEIQQMGKRLDEQAKNLDRHLRDHAIEGWHYYHRDVK